MELTLSQFSNYSEKLETLPSRSFVGIDFETTGLKARRGDKAFLIGLSSPVGDVSHFIEEGTAEVLARMMRLTNVQWAGHHVKFEMSFMKAQFELEFKADVWCTETFAKVEKNCHWSYKLQSCAEREGWEAKYKPALDWLDKNGPKYSEMPRELIVPYVEMDASLSRRLAEKQMKTFRSWQDNSNTPIGGIVTLERQTTKNLFAMEEAGIRVDLDYCHEALAYEKGRMDAVKHHFEARYGQDFVDSAKALTPLFDKEGITYGWTETGRASFTAEHLKANGVRSDLINWILEHRAAQKRANTYWEGLIEHTHPDGRIHPNIRQCGAETFRMSITDPSAQTWPDDGDDPSCRYPIRRALVASRGNSLVSIDFSQMELRLMCDEADDRDMIDAIKSGRDFHQELADRAGVPRSLAKNGRFARLYGAGYKKVAQTLGIDEAKSKTLCEMMDEQSPGITKYCQMLIRYAKTDDFVPNWRNRRMFLESGFEYKAPNYRIQGGCAEILRIAIQDVGEFLKKEARGNTRMVLPIHDEIVFDMALRDFHLIPEIKRLMIAAHRSVKNLPMDVNVAIGPNLHDLKEWSTS